jgi:hypothetical protein
MFCYGIRGPGSVATNMLAAPALLFFGEPMFWWFAGTEAAAIRGLQTRLAAEQAEHAKTRNELAIANAQIEQLSLALARDRERIKAELAAYARQRADSEGENGRAG